MALIQLPKMREWLCAELLALPLVGRVGCNRNEVEIARRGGREIRSVALVTPTPRLNPRVPRSLFRDPPHKGEGNPQPFCGRSDHTAGAIAAASATLIRSGTMNGTTPNCHAFSAPIRWANQP